MASYKGKMFRDLAEDYDVFFEYGIGAMCWGEDQDGRRTLTFIAPCKESARGWEVARIFPMNDGENWAAAGDHNGWDGNEEHPTLKPSIWLRNKCGWHGYIENGNLRDV